MLLEARRLLTILTDLVTRVTWPFRRRRGVAIDAAERSEAIANAPNPAPNVMEPHEPRVFLLDMPVETGPSFRNAGFRVLAGSLGQPFLVTLSDGFVPVPLATTLPIGWTESEILVVDLAYRKPVDEPAGSKVTSNGELDWWAKCSRGIVDPRVRVALEMQEHCDRIYQHGGAFVLFLAPQIMQEISLGRLDIYNRVDSHKEIRAFPWSFLSALHYYLSVSPDTGVEIRLDPDFGPLQSLIGRELAGAEYHCTLRMAVPEAQGGSAVILRNKFDAPVGLIATCQEQKGVVVLLPQVRDKTGTALAVTQHLLPRLVPDLFPKKAAANWLHSAPYEHPPVQSLEGEIAELRLKTESKVSAIQERMGLIRSERSFLHDLITESGDPLKDAVRVTLEHLGFKHVVDVDKEGEDEHHGLMEDLRVEDKSPLILVEVKGLFGRPSDEDSLQVTKYVAPAMKRTGRTDVQGLTIINHERHRPGMIRDNVGLFRALVVENAIAQDIGLLTTWDLFCLYRNYEALQWPPTVVTPVLYRTGRINPYPDHYREVGRVERVWPEAEVVGIRLSDSLSEGETVALLCGWEFHEALILSIQVDGTKTTNAQSGVGAGLRIAPWRPPPVGALVFTVDQ